jgi:hypothetical protein
MTRQEKATRQRVGGVKRKWVASMIRRLLGYLTVPKIVHKEQTRRLTGCRVRRPDDGELGEHTSFSSGTTEHCKQWLQNRSVTTGSQALRRFGTWCTHSR